MSQPSLLLDVVGTVSSRGTAGGPRWSKVHSTVVQQYDKADGVNDTFHLLFKKRENTHRSTRVCTEYPVGCEAAEPDGCSTRQPRSTSN